MKGENALEGEETKFYAVFIVDDEFFEKEGFAGILKLDADVEEKKGVGEGE